MFFGKKEREAYCRLIDILTREMERLHQELTRRNETQSVNPMTASQAELTRQFENMMRYTGDEQTGDDANET